MRVVTRRATGDVPEGVEQAAADVGTAGGARQACEDAAVVYHCAQPDYRKWPELFPPMTQAVLDGAAEAGAKLVFADNLYMYGPPDGPMTEETPQRAEGRKGRMRIEIADAVLRAHADGRLRSTIGRSSDYYGPRGTGTAAWPGFGAITASRSVRRACRIPRSGGSVVAHEPCRPTQREPAGRHDEDR